MKFWKMNGAGNDFIIINNIEEKIPESAFSAIAAKVCERHLSIGADGLMVVEKAIGDGDYLMRFYNSDGSEGEMCGNGARCICRYGYENGLAG
ncbi:MAG: diaminopimelate epimerase, partial [Oscillospiraceae bacterium]|nr:diaminopimelate epimerase [Oscillospiraceae bacterium]